MDTETEQSAIEEFLHILEEHRKNCEQQGKYVEADIAKNRLAELKAHEVKRQEEAMLARQISDMLGVEEAHMLEFKQFNMNWDKKMSDYEEKVVLQTQNMKQNHETQLQKYLEDLNKKQQKPKFSTDLLNYRKVEEHLVKSKDYGEAHKTKQKADELEAVEIERWTKRRRKDVNRSERQFKERKGQEIAALEKRLQTGREGGKKQRQFQLEW
eukprot:scaffold4084_cov227-Chaetoceros_neogracile.AAC.3